MLYLMGYDNLFPQKPHVVTEKSCTPEAEGPGGRTSHCKTVKHLL